MAGPQPELLQTGTGTMHSAGMPNAGQTVIYTTDPSMLPHGGMQASMDGNYYNAARIILHPSPNMHSPGVMQPGAMHGAQGPQYIAVQRTGTPGMHSVMQQGMSGPMPSYAGPYSAQAAMPAANVNMNSTMNMYPSPLRSKTSETRPRASSYRKSCNCKNSRCLKLYCECFASGRYCDTCNCVNCYNNKNNEQIRMAAVEAILERNPNAFRPKIQGEEQAQQARAVESASVRHTKGCNCKKSNCLKKYCECFQAGIHCSDNCKCMECKNFEGSEARAMVLASQDGSTNPSIALHAMPSPSPAKRSRLLAPITHQYPVVMQKNMMSTGMMSVGPPMMQSMPQTHTPAARTLTPTGPQGHAPMPTPTPRSTAKEVVHKVVKQDMITQLCNLLVLVSGKAAEAAIADQEHELQRTQQHQQQQYGQQTEIKQDEQQGTTSNAGQDRSEGATPTPALSNSNLIHPSTLQQDGTAPATGRPSEDPGGGVGLSPSESFVYQAQEKAVLEEFKSILLKIIDTTQHNAPDGIPVSAHSMDHNNLINHTESPQGMPYMIVHQDGMGPGRPQSMPPKRNLHGLQSLNLHQKLQSVLHDKNEGTHPSVVDAVNSSWDVAQSYNHHSIPASSRFAPSGPTGASPNPDPFSRSTGPTHIQWQSQHPMEYHHPIPSASGRLSDPLLSPRRISQPRPSLSNSSHPQYMPPSMPVAQPSHVMHHR